MQIDETAQRHGMRGPTLPPADAAVIGTGIVGIAVAYYLATRHGLRGALIDSGGPMSLTSAQSGENCRIR